MTLIASVALLAAASPGFWARYTADMPHRHVLLAYGFAWAIQLGYLVFVLSRARIRSKSDQHQ